MGEMVKAKLIRPVTDYAKVYGWSDRYSPTLLDAQHVLGRRARSSAPATSTGSRRSGEIVGVFYNKDKVPTPPTTLDEFEASLQKAKDAGETPIMFGNLEKWPGIHNFESVLGQTADKQAIRDFVFAKDGASFDNPEFTAGATKINDWVKKGYFNKNFNGTDYDPAWKAFAKGKSPYLIAGTWVTADLAEQMGDNVGFMLMPGKDPDAPVSLGGESLPFTITSSAKNPDVAAAYIDFLTDANAAKVLVDTDNLPAMKGAPAPAGGLSRRRGQRVAEAQRGRRRDPVPGLHDADVLRRHRRRDPGAAGRQAGPGRVHQGRAGGVRQVGGVPLRILRGSPDDRPPGEPRLVGYLYLLPAFAVFAAFVLYPLYRRGLHLAVRLGRADGRHLDGPEQLQGRLHRPRAARRVRARAGAADLLRGAAGARSGCCWRG